MIGRRHEENGSISMTLTGTVRGNTIVLDQNPGLADGTRVVVLIQTRQFPSVIDDANFNPMSSQRPMSDEEREELERVYQDRGCGIECEE
jgi:hypothetical protein